MLVMFAVGAFAQETKYIDSHMHCAVLDDNMGLDKAIKWMDANNIERGVILELEGSEAHNEADRKKWRELFKKYEGRLSPFIRMDARDVTTKEATLEFLNQRKSDGAIGFGEYYIQDGERSFESPKVDIILEACADVGFPFLFHLQDAKDGFPSILENTLKKHPKCIFIAHANGWWCRMGTGDLDRLLQTYPNLYADVSAGSGG